LTGKIKLLTVLGTALALFAFLAGIVHANPFMGVGKSSTKQFKLPAGIYVIKVENKGFGKYDFWLIDNTNKRITQLASGVGPYVAHKVVGIPVQPKPPANKPVKPVKYFVQATEADGDWTVTITSTGVALDRRNFSGNTDSIIATPIFKLKKGSYNFCMLHKGGREFQAILYNGEGKKVTELGNAVGYYKNTAKVDVPKDGKFIMEIKASGEYAVTIQEAVK